MTFCDGRDGGRVTTFVWTAVLGAALLHALWNSVVKSAGDKFMGSARVALWTGVVAVAGRSGHAGAVRRRRCRM